MNIDYIEKTSNEEELKSFINDSILQILITPKNENTKYLEKFNDIFLRDDNTQTLNNKSIEKENNIKKDNIKKENNILVDYIKQNFQQEKTQTKILLNNNNKEIKKELKPQNKIKIDKSKSILKNSKKNERDFLEMSFSNFNTNYTFKVAILNAELRNNSDMKDNIISKQKELIKKILSNNSLNLSEKKAKLIEIGSNSYNEIEEYIETVLSSLEKINKIKKVITLDYKNFIDLKSLSDYNDNKQFPKIFNRQGDDTEYIKEQNKLKEKGILLFEEKNEEKKLNVIDEQHKYIEKEREHEIMERSQKDDKEEQEKENNGKNNQKNNEEKIKIQMEYSNKEIVQDQEKSIESYKQKNQEFLPTEQSTQQKSLDQKFSSLFIKNNTKNVRQQGQKEGKDINDGLIKENFILKNEISNSKDKKESEQTDITFQTVNYYNEFNEECNHLKEIKEEDNNLTPKEKNNYEIILLKDIFEKIQGIGKKSEGEKVDIGNLKDNIEACLQLMSFFENNDVYKDSESDSNCKNLLGYLKKFYENEKNIGEQQNKQDGSNTKEKENLDFSKNLSKTNTEISNKITQTNENKSAGRCC